MHTIPIQPTFFLLFVRQRTTFDMLTLPPLPFSAFRAAAVTLIGLLGAHAALAQTPQATGEARNLETVVVTASGFEQALKDAPASITIVTGEELRKRPFRDLTDALRDVEGVAITGTANEPNPAPNPLLLIPSRITAGIARA